MNPKKENETREEFSQAFPHEVYILRGRTNFLPNESTKQIIEQISDFWIAKLQQSLKEQKVELVSDFIDDLKVIREKLEIK